MVDEKELDNRFEDGLNGWQISRRYPGVGNPVISIEMEKVGDGPAAVIGDETCKKPLVVTTGKAQGVGRSESQKTCLDILHSKVFEDKTVKGTCG